MITELLQELIRIPSENHGSAGSEEDVQKFYHAWLKAHTIDAELIYPEDIPAFASHPARLIEHDMTGRPNVIVKLHGGKPGKTLLLLAHADTVPVDDLAAWHDSPFSGKLEDGKIHGRGSGDDKWGMALMAGIALAVKNHEIELEGTLILASVADEEFGGGNGVAALLARGISADEAIYLDGGSNLSIWHAGLGGGFCRIYGGNPEAVKEAVRIRKEKIREKLYRHPVFGKDFFKIIEKQFFLTYEEGESIMFFHDTLPGDDENLLKQEFERSLPDCRFEWMSRFLKPAFVPKDDPLVTRLTTAFREAAGRDAPVIGGVQSDQGLLMHYGNIPCVLFGCGRRGLPGSAHLPDEFILREDLMTAFRTIRNFVQAPKR